MGFISSFCGAYNIRYDSMRLVAWSGWAWYNGRSLGRRQAVRHWVLVPAFAGSNPADPAIFVRQNVGGEAGPEGLPADPATRSPETGIFHVPFGCGRIAKLSCRPSHEVSGNEDFLMCLPAAAGLRSFPADPAIFVREKRPRGARPSGGSPG